MTTQPHYESPGILGPMVALAEALNRLHQVEALEAQIETEYEAAMQATQTAKADVITAGCAAARVLPTPTRDRLLADLPVKVELPVATTPRLVFPEVPNLPHRTKDREPLPRKVIMLADDPDLPETLRPPFKARIPSVQVEVYKWLRRNPRGQSAVQVSDNLGLNIRQVGNAIQQLQGKGLISYKNTPPSKAESKAHGRRGDGPLRVRQYYCVA